MKLLILQKLKTLKKELGFEIDPITYKKKTSFKKIFKDIQLELKNIPIKYCKQDYKEELKRIEKTTLGVLDGMTENPIDLFYLADNQKAVYKQVETIIEEFQEIYKEIQATQKTNKKPKRIIKSLKELDKINKDSPEEIEIGDVVDVNISEMEKRKWANDEEKLASFLKEDSSITAKEDFEIITKQIVLQMLLPKSIQEKLIKLGGQVESIFGEYTLIKNAKLLAVKKEQLALYDNPIFNYRFLGVISKISNPLTLMSQCFVLKKDYAYFLLGSPIKDFTFGKWGFE